LCNLTHQICLQLWSYEGVPISFIEKIWWTFFFHRYKKTWVPSTIKVVDFLFPLLPQIHMGMGYPPLASQPPPQSHTLMYTSKKLSNKKCNMMLSCDKSLCIVLDYWNAFVVHKNAQANFTHAHLNVTKHWQDSKFDPPPCKNSQLLGDWFWLPHTSTSPYMCLCSTTIGMPTWFLHGWHKLYDTQMISGTN
jgi:hypothetical protein